MRAPLLPRLSWLGCAVWACDWARVLAVPRYSWLGCLGVSVLVCVLRSNPATPGWGVRCGWVYFGSRFGCAPPLLAGVLGYACVYVRAPPVHHQSWLGSAVWVCVLVLGFRLRPATPGLGVGVCVCLCACSSWTPPHLAGVCGVGVFVCVLCLYPAIPGRVVWCGCVLGLRSPLRPAIPGWGVAVCVCLCACSARTPPLLAGVLGCACVCVRAPPVPCHSWLGSAVQVCVLGLWFRLRPATPRWGVRVCVCLCACCACGPPLLAGVCGVIVCLGSEFGCAPPPPARVLGCVCVCVRAPLLPRHSWLGFVVWVCVFGLRFRLHSATPGPVVGVCVCLCACSACTSPLLAGAFGAGVCALARVSALPCHSWLGFWVVGVFIWVRVWAAPRHSWLGCWGVDVCLSSGFGCAPPLVAGVLGCVCVCVHAPPVPRHSWLGRAVRVCVLGPGFRLCPATPGSGVGAWVCVFLLWFQLRPATLGWEVGLCVCLCACSACTAPPLAAACGADVCAWAKIFAAPHHSWLGCWGVCVFVCVLRLYPATPGWGVPCGCVCLGSGCGYAPPFPVGALGCVCVCLRAPLVPRHSWPGCAVWVCVLVHGFRLRPATPGWGLGVCVCLCVCSVCTPSFLAGWCVCVLASVLPALRVASCVRRVRFPPPSGGAVRGVGVCGSCRGWGLSPPSPFCFLFFCGLRVGGVVFGPVVSWLCGVRRCLSRSWDSWSPSALPFCLGLRLRFFFAHPCSNGVCVGVFGGVLSSGGLLLWAGCCWFWQDSPPMCFQGAPWVRRSVLSGLGVCPPPVESVRGFAAVCLSLVPPPPFFWGGGLPVPPSALPGLVHALVGIRCGYLGCCWCLRFARPCPGPMGQVGYVHAWPGGLFCRVRFRLCRLGGCARRFREALG